jgi:hypothetical protein
MQEKITYRGIYLKYFENITESKYLGDTQTFNKVTIPSA